MENENKILDYCAPYSLSCKKCNTQIEVPKGACPICFGDVLGDINDIEDKEVRYNTLTEWINELCAYDYECGLHNRVCANTLGEHDTPKGNDDYIKLGSSNRIFLDKIKEKLGEISLEREGIDTWKDATYDELICFCINHRYNYLKENYGDF